MSDRQLVSDEVWVWLERFVAGVGAEALAWLSLYIFHCIAAM